MSILDFFKSKKTVVQKSSTWKELGAYNARFTTFGSDIYASDLIRSCIRPIAEHTSKAEAKSTNEAYAKILNISPNIYMNGRDFLLKVRTLLEINNTVFIAIMRDDRGKATGFYPVPYSNFEALDYNGRLYIKFRFRTSGELVLPWDDIAVVRKDYNKYDIAGDDNSAIVSMLDIINTTNQGIANAVKATANLRGILKSTKAMLSDADIKKNKDRFVKDYLNLENEGGIASLDATQEFTPISMSPTVTNWEQQKEFRENIYRYFGVSDAIVMSNYTEQQMEAFYDARIEPFLVALSVELTKKVFTDRERGFGAQIVYESNRIQFASTATKLGMVQLVDRGLLTPNEYRQIFNLAPYEGGDEFILRLDTAATGNSTNDEPMNEEPEEQEGEDNGNQE